MTNKYRKCKTDNDPKYDNIKKRVKETNTVVVTSMSISGEGVSGIFNAFAILTFLRWHIINDTYHPYMFKYYIGVSVGSIVVGVVLNVRFLYEEYGKDKSLEYLDAILSMFSFETMRRLFLDMGDNEVFGPFNLNLVKLISNLYNYGSICTRDVVKRFLQAEKIPNFDNTENYFTTKRFYDWLDNELDNVFIVSYSAQQTKMVTFTGNTQRFNKCINFVKYQKLTPVNLIHAIICSSSIPLLHPVINIDGTNYATDGSSAERNQICFLQTMINCSYFFSSNLLYTSLLIFFGIDDKLDDGTKRTNFTIIHNKLNSQEWLEIPDQYPHRQVKVLQSIQSLLNYIPRIIYNATNNIPLLSLFRQQPFIKQFSNINVNHIKNAEFQLLKNVVKTQQKVIDNISFQKRIPSYEVCKKMFKDPNYGLRNSFKSFKAYQKAYTKYKVLTTNQPISTYLYESNPSELVELLDENYQFHYDEDSLGDFIMCDNKQYIPIEYDSKAEAYVRIENGNYVTTTEGSKINIDNVPHPKDCDLSIKYNKNGNGDFTEDSEGPYVKAPKENRRKRRTLSLDICYFEVNIRDLFEKDILRWLGMFTNDLIGNAEEQVSFMKNMGIVSGNLLFDMTTRQQTYSFKENAKHSEAPNELNEVVEEAYEGFLGPIQS